jgi:hypothetical protein
MKFDLAKIMADKVEQNCKLQADLEGLREAGLNQSGRAAKHSKKKERISCQHCEGFCLKILNSNYKSCFKNKELRLYNYFGFLANV